jgi:large subunit ribosomal protein L17
MKKKVFGRQLSRERDTRRALFRALIRALVEHGKIVTTKAKAKAIQGRIDKLVNLAKDGSIHSSRRLFAALGNDKVTAKALSEKVAKSLADRKSGYTRIINLPRRKGDAAEIVRLEWVKEVLEPVKEKPKTKKKETVKKETKKTKKK